MNTERRGLTEEFLARGREQVPAVVPPLIAVGAADFHPGVVGLVAGKLAEEFGAPDALLRAGRRPGHGKLP